MLNSGDDNKPVDCENERLANKYVANNMEETYTELNFAYPRQYKDKLAFNNYGHQDRAPEKGMTIMSFPDNHTPMDNDLIPPSQVIINDMKNALVPPENLPSNKFNFDGKGGGGNDLKGAAIGAAKSALTGGLL